ncbi:MAG: OsmC family protein [Prolixibacteraceae bacterium]|jgi:uncharacterized OsmC-like protein|nr:OsmC family protein [Prolixibacteraceae bacterium]
MGLLNFSIKGGNENPTKFVANARNFKVIVDEPAALGGTDHGPNPVEYLLAGYAGCLNVVAHLVAKELGIEIKKLAIEVDGDLNPAKFLGQSNDDRAGFQSINVSINIDTDADQLSIDKWLKEVENRCPINDNLRNTTPVNVKVSTFEVAA